MKNYNKPYIFNDTGMKFEPVFTAGESGDELNKQTKVTCPKMLNQYSADWTCSKKNCPYYVEVAGMKWMNDQCTLAK